MMLCGKCGRDPCECRELATGRHPAEWATGARLDELAAKAKIERAPREPDGTLRSRVQFSIINGVPYRAGIPGGRVLERQAGHAGVRRGPGEDDAHLLARWLVEAWQRRQSLQVDRSQHAIADE
jgi:hypothetical protein